MPPTPPFANGYQDRSTDFGYQFEFTCQRCDTNYLSTEQKAMAGATDTVTRAAGGLFGGLFGSKSSAGSSLSEKARQLLKERALGMAIAEVGQKFMRCNNCKEWVCRENCWNAQANQCTRCAPLGRQIAPPTLEPPAARSGFGPVSQRPTASQTPPAPAGFRPASQRPSGFQPPQEGSSEPPASMGQLFGRFVSAAMSGEGAESALEEIIGERVVKAGISQAMDRTGANEALTAMLGQVIEKASAATGIDLQEALTGVRCPHCGKAAGTGRFCANCGKSLHKARGRALVMSRCRTCCSDLPAHATHCKQCGASTRPRAKWTPPPARNIPMATSNWRDS